MATLVWTPSSVSTYYNAGSYDTAWTTSTEVTLSPGHGGRTRRINSAGAFDAIHDYCTINSIKIEFTASQSVGLCDMFAYADTNIGVSVSKQPLTSTSATYSTTGGAGTLPSSVRGMSLDSSAMNYDAFGYTSIVYMLLPVVTVDYTDPGIPSASIFFGSNF